MATTPPIVTFSIAPNLAYGGGTAHYAAFPTRLSIPQAAGAWPTGLKARLCDMDGKPVAADVRPMLTWPDGSTRVWEIWFPVSLDAGDKSRAYRLEPLPDKTPTAATYGAWLNEPAKFLVSVVLGDGTRLEQGVAFPSAPRPDAPATEHEDEQPFTLVRPSGAPAFRGALIRRTWSWYGGQEISARLIQCGPEDTLGVRSVCVEFDLPALGNAARYVTKQSCHMVGRPRLVEIPGALTIRSDGGGCYVTDATQLGEDESKFPAYERGRYICSVDNWSAFSDGQACWLFVMPWAAERAPKGWKIDGHHVSVDLHPQAADGAAPLEWRQGMALHHRFVLAKLPPQATPIEIEGQAMAWLRPPIVQLDADVYRAAGWRLPFRYEPARYPRTEFNFRDSFSFGWARGTFDWGDDVTARPRSFGRNLEYDFPAVAAKEYARTGHTNILRLLEASAQHMIYTDFIDYSDDPWKEGGIAAHCVNHTSGSCYPSHMWAEGITLYYQLTGDRYALRVAQRVGDFFLKHINHRFDVVDATAREMGWLLIAVAAIYDLTREERYLEGLRKVVDFYLPKHPSAFFGDQATFTIGVAIIGLDRVRPFYKDAQLRKFIIGVADWILNNRTDGTGLYDYWRDDERPPIPYIQTHLPEALNIAYHLSGDEKYLRSAWRQYMIHLGGGQLTVQGRYAQQECGYAAGNYISWIGCLASFSEKGWLEKVQYPQPWAG